jgi:4'-phosphopantetheinyl transferase
MEKLFQKALNDPRLTIVTRADWGAHNPQHKELIYAALDQHLQRSPHPHSSISHTESEGGFVLSQFPVGFDIEVSERVTEKIVARVSSEEEVRSSPSFASLWSAKEASFKALKHFHQPTAMSQIKISFGENAFDRIRLFTIENERKFDAFGSIGAVMETSTLTYCVLIFRA